MARHRNDYTITHRSKILEHKVRPLLTKPQEDEHAQLQLPEGIFTAEGLIRQKGRRAKVHGKLTTPTPEGELGWDAIAHIKLARPIMKRLVRTPLYHLLPKTVTHADVILTDTGLVSERPGSVTIAHSWAGESGGKLQRVFYDRELTLRQNAGRYVAGIGLTVMAATGITAAVDAKDIYDDIHTRDMYSSIAADTADSGAFDYYTNLSRQADTALGNAEADLLESLIVMGAGAVIVNAGQYYKKAH